MTVRKCKYEDILAVSEMEKECFKGESWSYGTIASAFDNPAYVMVVAEEGGEVIGYGCISIACENSDLENVLVSEEYRNSGVGSAIIRELLREAEERGAEHTFLEVRVSNSAALSLYLKNGFAGVYARSRYYSDGEDCLVMRKVFNRNK